MSDLRQVWRQLTRERDAVYVALDTTDLGFAADAELDTIIDACARISQPGHETDVDAIAELGAVLEVVAARQALGVRPEAAPTVNCNAVANGTAKARERLGGTPTRPRPRKRRKQAHQRADATPEPTPDNVIPLPR